MTTVLGLLGCFFGFAPTSVLLAKRGCSHFVLWPFLAAWLLALLLIANVEGSQSHPGPWYGDVGALLCLSLWLASPLLGAAWVTNQFEPADGVLDTVFGATVAAIGGLVAGTIAVLAICSP